ncbi:MAG: 6-carboxytetrahydropterin synthase [Phycisphaerales bacterium]
MFRLSRTVRFAINRADAAPGVNGYAGNPPMLGLGAHYELDVECVGDLGASTGYVINIKEIDRAVRAAALPVLVDAYRNEPTADLCVVLLRAHRALADALALPLGTLRWRLTPYHSLEVLGMNPDAVLLRQKFDFCAAHRLHNPGLSAEENRRLFGKCNHLGGHGHNYQFEPCVQLPLPSAATGAPFALADLERLADETIVQRFDHKNLNTDTAEFRDGSGLNPSVENIARVCFQLLDAAIRRASATSNQQHAATLRCVRVWESDRTSCTYPG